MSELPTEFMVLTMSVLRYIESPRYRAILLSSCPSTKTALWDRGWLDVDLRLTSKGNYILDTWEDENGALFKECE